MGEGGITCQRRGLEGKRTRDKSSGLEDKRTKTKCKTAKYIQRALSNNATGLNRNRRATTNGKAVSARSGNCKDVDKTKGKLPLSGKVVYLDIKESRIASSLEIKLKKLGAEIETFLSKGVNYVISATPPSRSDSQARVQGECLGPDSPSFANSPSPFNTPSPTYVGGKIIPVTRGQAMAQIARSRNRSPSPSSAVASALKLGIKVISIEGAQKWVNKELEKLGHAAKDHRTEAQGSPKKKKSSFVKYKRLQQTYIKVESSNGHYRPLFSEMAAWPHINVDTPATTCPFDGKGAAAVQQSGRGDKDGLASIGHFLSPCTQSATHRRSMEGEDSSKLVGCPILTAGDLRREREKRRREQRRRGYCECCSVKYNDIDKHVQEQSHREFARDKSNYDDLDTLIRGCPSTSQFLHSILLRHCTQRAAFRPATSVSIQEDNSSSSKDQVITVEYSTPQKLDQPQTNDQPSVYVPPSLDIPFAEQRTPTHIPQYPTNSANSPARKTCRGHHPSQDMQVDCFDDQDKDPNGCLNFSKNNLIDSAKDEPVNLLLPAVVIRRPGVKGVYGSPRMKWGQRPSHNQTGSECTPKKVRERSLIFGNASIASLRSVPEDLETASGSVDADSSTNAKQRKDTSLSAEIDEKNILPMDYGRKRRRQLSYDNIHTTASRRSPVQSTSQNFEPSSGSVEVNMTPLNQSPGKICAQETYQKNGRKSSDGTSRKANSSSAAFLDVPARVKSSRASSEVAEKMLVKKGKDFKKNEMKENPDKSHVKRCRSKRDTVEVESLTSVNSDKVIKRSPDFKQKQIKMEDSTTRKVGSGRESIECAHLIGKGELSAQESGTQEDPTQTSPVLKSNLLSNRKTPPLANTDRSPPVSQRSPRKRHIVSSTPAHVPNPSNAAQTPPKSYSQHLLEEEMGSSPIYPRATIHNSTPVILTTRKLRHVDDAISQDASAVCELLELEKPLVRKRSRRSVFCKDAQAKSSNVSVSAPTGEEELNPLVVEDKKKAVRRRSSRNNQKVELDLSSPQTLHQEKEMKLPSVSAESLSPEDTVSRETLRKSEEGKKNYLDMSMKLMRPCQSVAPKSTKKVKLSNSWLLLSDNSMSRLLQSESDHSTFKGFQGNEALSSGYSYEYKSEVEVTDDEEREWIIDQEKQNVEKEEESDLGNFIPLFSSPGKRSDSSWGDACDQYLDFTVQHRLQGEQQQTRSPSKALASPNTKKRKRSDADVQQKCTADTGGSNRSKKRHLSKKKLAAQPCMLTPTKQLRGTQSERSSRDGQLLQTFPKQGEEIVRVDEEVLFNYASPQKDNSTLSPLRVLNSNVAVSPLSPRTRSRFVVGPVKLPQPFSLE